MRFKILRKTNKRKFKAQAQMMEYSMMTFVLMIIIVLMVLFLFGWWSMQSGIERTKETSNRALFMTKNMLYSTYFTSSESMKKDPMFGDVKLSAMEKVDCEELQKVYGTDWFMEMELADGSKQWFFCVNPDPGKKFTAFELPVNVFIEEREEVVMAVLKVGVYYE